MNEKPITNGDLRGMLRRAAELADQAGDHERAERLRWRIRMLLLYEAYLDQHGNLELDAG